MAQKYVDIIKTTSAYKALSNDIKKGRVMHAYLLVCEDKLMLDILSSLFISECISGDYSRVFNYDYADISHYPLEEKKKVLKEDIEDLTQSIYYTPVELDKKFYVVDYAESMNETAQNKLLKTLEEPPIHSHIILKCTNDRAILPTIKSRCERIEVFPLSYESIENELDKHYPRDERFYLSAVMSRGFLGIADNIMNSKSYLNSYRLALDTLVFMKSSKQALTFSSKWLEQKANLKEIIDCTELILHDCMLASTGEIAKVKFRTSLKEILELSKVYTDRAVILIKPFIYRAKKRIEGNGNTVSIIDQLLLSILEVKAKCQRL